MVAQGGCRRNQGRSRGAACAARNNLVVAAGSSSGATVLGTAIARFASRLPVVIALAVLLMVGTLAPALLAEWCLRGTRQIASPSRHDDD